MSKFLTSLTIAEWGIVVGSIGFITVLFLSAAWEPDIRWLHFFQSWMYLATLAASLKRDKWGYFLGISIALFWDYTNLCVTTFLHAGLDQLSILVSTGKLPHPEYFIAVPAWTANLILLCSCAWAYARLERNKQGSDVLRWLAALVISTGYFAAIMALFQPRYLGLFPRLLHPHFNV